MDRKRHEEEREEESSASTPDSGRGALAETSLIQAPIAQMDEDETAPPPTYEEAVATRQPEPEPEQEDDEGLSPSEIAVVLRMQDERSSYLPPRRDSHDEAIEMALRGHRRIVRQLQEEAERKTEENNDDRDAAGIEMESGFPLAHVDTSQPVTVRPPQPATASMRTAEEGKSRRRERMKPEDAECTSCGDYLNPPCTSLYCFLLRQSRTRLTLVAIFVVVVLGLLLFVSLFPASFVYVDYHNIALKQSKLTGRVDRDTVLYTGCYVLGPDTTLVLFESTVHDITETIQVFTLDTLSITMTFSMQYFLRPKEVGKLYTMFLDDYNPVFKSIAVSTIKNYCGTELTVDEFRFNRTYIEKQLHIEILQRLGGNCCPECCPSGCQHNSYCSMCKTDDCYQGYHVDVRFFHILGISIPNAVFERYLHNALLVIEAERETFYQQYAVTTKETELVTQQVYNEAQEILQNATAYAAKIQVEAEAAREVVVQKAYATALKGLFSSLNVTQEDHQLSLMMIRALEEAQDNLYMGYAYDQNIVNTP